LIFILFFHPVFAQVSFRTIVPQRPVTAGESFQVQYIIENATNISNFSPPDFSGLRVVTGPHIYTDRKTNSAKNLVLTLVAKNEGKFKIPGAMCLIDGQLLTSNDVFVQVVSSKDSDESSYYLRPGEDPIKKIHNNLFLKLTIDKQTCFIGEPLVATFKLYSRLQSKSNRRKSWMGIG
ncbi:MAG TPA: BatD family protein, partial [Chitinophagaceae bacterium]